MYRQRENGLLYVTCAFPDREAGSGRKPESGRRRGRGGSGPEAALGLRGAGELRGQDLLAPPVAVLGEA